MASMSIFRLLGLPAALAVALVASGCPAQNQSPVQTSVSPTAMPTTGTSATDEPVNLASPSVDSDLDAEDNAAVQNAMQSEEMEAYMPSDLIHDGGVILYRTMANRDLDIKRPLDALTDPPTDWRRVEGRKGGKQLQLRKDGQVSMASNEKRARVVARYGVAGKFVIKANGKEVAKPFQQQFTRTFRFVLKDAKWQLEELTALQHESQGGRSGVDIAKVALFRGAETTAFHEVSDQDRFSKPDEVSVFTAGETIRVEVTASQKNNVPPFVFAYLVGGTDRARQALRDDGTNGDRTANDGIFTGSVLVPATPGLRHLAIDVINPAAFQPAGLVRSNGLGLSFRVQVK